MEAAKVIKERLGKLRPKIAMVLGSGLGGLVEKIKDPVRIPYDELSGFPKGGVSGHAGEVVAGTIGAVPVVMLSGRVHYYEHGDASAMRKPIEALAGIGVEKLILTNSAGSLREDLPPGSVMLINDHINFSGTNPLFGEPTDKRFVGLTNAYDSEMMAGIKGTAAEMGISIGEGVYMWFSGPSFETPAEIKMAKIMGADAVGMSTVPEVILARFMDLKVAAFSVVTNFAAGMTGSELSHTETKEMAPLGGQKLGDLIAACIAEEKL